MHKLKVYDQKNQARLLGTLEVPVFKGAYYRVEIQAAPPLWGYLVADRPETVRMEDAEFKLEWVKSTEDETPFRRVRVQDAILVTNTSLATLMKLRQFKPEGIEYSVSYHDFF